MGFTGSFRSVLQRKNHTEIMLLTPSDLSYDPIEGFIYFSYVTLTTLGHGDIAAVSPVARTLAMLEALIGQLFPAILIARLVSMELYYRRSK